MLSGTKVELRAVERDDVRRLWELLEDLEISYLSSNDPVRPESLAQAESRYEARLTEPPPDRINFVVEVNGEVIGECQLHGIDHYRRVCDLGIALGRDYWGQGFGQDVVRTLVDYAFTHLNMNKVSLEVLADDARAVGCYARVGFVEEGRLRQHAWVNGARADALVMSVLREEWASA
ncbi:MAG: GNAT family N-acetyltransferase [Actinomycetota bacterium]|nr:GNAT family N-acetyltransferase [Actinomycetota bacterium]